MKEFTVILARAHWCGHCRNFEPIYEETRTNYMNDEFLSKYKVNFKDYDLANDDGKNNFTLNHLDAMNLISGYPTVLIHINDKNTNKYFPIDHTVINHNLADEQEKKTDASKRFMTNISNFIKSLESDNKFIYKQLQSGGAIKKYKTSMEEAEFREKYLKYKKKYSDAKKKLNNK